MSESDKLKYLQYADLSISFAEPHQLNPKPDVNQLYFGKYFTDHMLKIHYYESMNGWQAPEIMPFGNIALHPAAKVFHYAIEVYMIYFIIFYIIAKICFMLQLRLKNSIFKYYIIIFNNFFLYNEVRQIIIKFSSYYNKIIY